MHLYPSQIDFSTCLDLGDIYKRHPFQAMKRRTKWSGCVHYLVSLFIISLFKGIVLFAYLFKLFDWLASYSATEKLNSFELFRAELQRFRWRTIYCLNNGRSAPGGIFRLVENRL